MDIEIIDERIEITLGGEDLPTVLAYVKQNLRETITIKTVDYTFTLADANTSTILMNKASSALLTIPHSDDVDFPIGTILKGVWYGAGETSFQGDVGVTVNSPETLTIMKRYAQATAMKVAQDVWLLSGNLQLEGGYAPVFG